MKRIESTLKGLVDKSICCGCGVCAGVCPTDALEMEIIDGRYLPVLSKERCTDCRLCEQICNYGETDTLKIIKPVEGLSFHPYVGHYVKCYIGYSNDQNIREISASGGLVSSILVNLLKSGNIDGAIVTKLSYQDQKVVARPFIAKNKSDILSACGSHYLPVDFSKVIKEVLHSKEKYAIVALPCINNKIRKAKELIPSLNERIIYIFGLFCNQTFKYSFIEHIKSISNIPLIDNFDFINFRCGWPDYHLLIRTKDREYKIHKDNWSFMFDLKMYSMKACIYCEDCFAESSDISFGDAWITKIKKRERLGTSICISRNNKANYFLNRLSKSRSINLREINIDELIKSHKQIIYFKKIQNICLKNHMITNPIVPITILLCSLTRNISNEHKKVARRIPLRIYKVLHLILNIGIIIYFKINKFKGNNLNGYR